MSEQKVGHGRFDAYAVSPGMADTEKKLRQTVSAQQARIERQRDALIHLLADIANAEHEKRPVSKFYIDLARAALSETRDDER